MKDGFLEGPDIAYRTNRFDPARQTLVFVHGLSGTCSAWEPFEKALENSYNIVTYDLRGHGLSTKYLKYTDYALNNFADDLHALLTHLGIVSCELIAHSMGATVAVAYLHYYPGTVKSMLFLAPNYKQHSLAGSFNLRALDTAIQFFSSLQFIPKPGHRIDYSRFGYSPDISLKRIVPEIKDMTLRVYLYCLRQLYGFTHDSWWSEIAVPVTIVHGTHDFFVPYRFGAELSEVIPNSKLITLQNANHMLVLNNKKEIIELIKENIKNRPTGLKPVRPVGRLPFKQS
jgi:pimeloyl-ACP methyl ester carboxylesterase